MREAGLRILLLGPPGSGKGTQASRLADHYGIAHISTGEMFRSQRGELGRRVAEVMNRGGYVPDDITIEMLRARLEEPDARQGFVLDGFPRTRAQAEALDLLLDGRGLDAVVLLEVPEGELVSRLSVRGRPDDTDEAIRTRLRVYEAETEPLIGFYGERGLLRSVPGVGEIGEITKRIVELLGT